MHDTRASCRARKRKRGSPKESPRVVINSSYTYSIAYLTEPGPAVQPVQRHQPTMNANTYRRQPAPHPTLGSFVSASSSTSSPSNDNRTTSFVSSSPVRNVEPPAIPETAHPSHPLSPEQLQVLERVKTGKSVFFTGSAGTYLSPFSLLILSPSCSYRHG
jgi:hypothetical protein